MYSQCPECLTRFRVTAAALRTAHGTVRCGRCGSAFDALQRLTDTVPDEPAGATLAALGSSGHTGTGGATGSGASDGDADVGTEFHFSADDIEQVFIDARDWQKRFPRAVERTARDSSGANEPSANGRVDDEDDARSAAAAQSATEDPEAAMIPAAGAPVVFVHEPEAVEDITLEGERIVIEGLPELDDDLRDVFADEAARDDAVKMPGGHPPPVDPDSTDRFEVLRVVPTPEDSATAPAQVPEVPAESVDQQQDAHAAGQATDGESATPVPTPPPIVPFRLRQRPAALDEELDDGAGEAAVQDGRGFPIAWGLGALVLAVALVGQLTHPYRQDLARDAKLGPMVRSVYARLGRPLAPNWDLAAFEVRQWGASEAAPSADGAMTVRASLRNGAGFAQPLPLLRLELEDRFGGTVARRDFAPAEYLNDPAQASRLLASGAETEAELDVIAAGADAVGYRLDVCVREDSGSVRCAQAPAGASPPR